MEDDFPSIIKALNAENATRTFRGTMVLAAAAVEDYFGRIVWSFLAAGTEAEELLDAANGPVGPIVQRIKLAVSLGLVSPEVGRVGRDLAKIRNAFAHKVHAEFDQGSIARLENCERIMWGKVMGSDELRPEQRFSNVCVLVLMYLHRRLAATGGHRLSLHVDTPEERPQMKPGG